MSEATIYNWLKQERIDCGEIEGSTTDQAVELAPRSDESAARDRAGSCSEDQQDAGARRCRGAVDSRGQSAAVIELIAVDVVRLADADLRLAVEEGEGFESVAEWREAHERFWNDEVPPTLPVHLVAPLTDETLVVVERFRLLANKSA